MAAPLVSVMLPCFNAAATLPMALGSLRAQTIEDWECVCVDDGSSDGTWAMLQRALARDPRFRIERFSGNVGRGAARQRALELARGELLAFLDADDWMYPERLEREARWLAGDESLVAVSARAAVTDRPDHVIGVYSSRAGSHPSIETFTRPRAPHGAFPAWMVRTAAAREAGFDPAFRRSQDSDFLMRVLLGRRYVEMPDVLYAYSQGSAASLAKTLDGYRFRLRSHMRYFPRFPLSVSRTVLETVAKMAVFAAAGIVGRERALIERRWHPADEATREEFVQALRKVQRAAEELSQDR